MKNKWRITAKDVGKRLDVFLAEKMPELTRSHLAKRLKQSDSGFVNDAPVSAHHFLKLGDHVEFRDIAPTRRGAKDVTLSTPSLRIIEETPEYLVIDKPAGLLVHPDAKQKSGTLVDALLAHDSRIAKLGADPERAGIIHRLDREVSGLMVIPKTQHAFEHLSRQFAEHSVEKKYLALVYGMVRQDEGDIKFRIAHSRTRQRMAARPEGETEGKAAWTHYKTQQRFRSASLLELTILSGRTHQIRAHLFALNHPIVGDPLYKHVTNSKQKIPTERMMLQSIHLSFKDPATEQQKTYIIDPVPEFARLMHSLPPAPKKDV